MNRYRTNTKKPINRKKKYREGSPVGEPMMMDEVDVVAPKFKPKGLFKGIRQRIARNINPYSYENAVKRVSDAVLRNKKEPENSFARSGESLKERQALLDIAMGQPVRDTAIGAIQTSRYRPSDSSDSSATYFSSPVTEENIKAKFDHKRNMQTIPQFLKTGEGVKYQNKYIAMLRSDENINSLTREAGMNFLRRRKPNGYGMRNPIAYPGDESFIGRGDDYNNMYGETLGNFTIDLGEDDKGKYISYYDKWDLDPLDRDRGIWSHINTKKLQSEIGVTSPEIYGRLYYKENPDGSITYLDEEGRGSKKKYRNETKED